MKGFGLVGFPLSHSFSRQYFTEKFKRELITDCYYKNFPLREIGQLPALVYEHPDLRGLNITIPYKEQVMAYLDDLDEGARSVGAVNTVKIIRTAGQNILKGYNTDVYGFRTSLSPFLLPEHKAALILGTGGASKAVAHVLKDLEIEMIYVSRNPRTKDHIAYKDITYEIISFCQIIINTSPVGMYPNVHEKPDIPYQYVTSRHILFDLIYNPQETEFMKAGKARGAAIVNGKDMLYHQAEKAWEIWNSTEQ